MYISYEEGGEEEGGVRRRGRGEEEGVGAKHSLYIYLYIAIYFKAA